MRARSLLLSASLLAPLAWAPAPVRSQDVTAMISEGRFDEVVAMYPTVAADQAEQIAQQVFAQAYQVGFQRLDYPYAIRGFTAAKRLPGLSAQRTAMLDFWHGFSIYRLAANEADPQTLESAERTLPMFREVEMLLESTGDYTAANNINLDQILSATHQYIRIQEALIQRAVPSE